MINVQDYNGENKLLMMGYLSALIGASIWNLVATLFGLPVSGTHSIVGAIIGFSVVGKGLNSVKWDGLTKIGMFTCILFDTVNLYPSDELQWFLGSLAPFCRE